MMIFNSSEVWVWWQNSFGMKFNSLLIQLCRFYPSSKGKLRLGVIFLCQAFIIALHWPRKRQRQPRSPSTLYLIFDSSTRTWSTDRIGTKCLGKGPATKSDEFSEKFQTAFDPSPLIFGKLYCKFLWQIWLHNCEEVWGPDSMKFIHMPSSKCVLISFFSIQLLKKPYP